MNTSKEKIIFKKFRNFVSSLNIDIIDEEIIEMYVELYSASNETKEILKRRFL